VLRAEGAEVLRKRTQNVDLPDPVTSYNIRKMMLESNIRTHCTIQNECSRHATCIFIPERDGRLVISTSPLEERYSINLILGFCDFDTHVPSPLFRLIVLLVWTVTVLLAGLFKSKSLIVSKFTSWDAL
jgi:hypothetical protein